MPVQGLSIRTSSHECSIAAHRLRGRNDHLKAVKLFKKWNEGHNLSVLLETDFMSDELSQLDTDNEARKWIHQEELEKAAQLTTAEVKDRVAIWEVVRQGYRLKEVHHHKWILELTCNMFSWTPSWTSWMPYVLNNRRKWATTQHGQGI